jgi:hypothetical protein
MGPTPVKSLRASAVVLHRTTEQDSAWVRQVEAVKERLRQQQEAAQTASSALAAAGSDPTAEGSEPAEVVALSTGEAEPWPLPTVEAAVKATTAKASVRDAERAGVDVAMEEVPPVAGQEAVQARGPWP